MSTNSEEMSMEEYNAMMGITSTPNKDGTVVEEGRGITNTISFCLLAYAIFLIHFMLNV